MPGKHHHEQLYRGEDQAAKIADARITVCGAGALGSNLVDSLNRQGFTKLAVIDFDRVEEHNVSTQIYDEGDIGALKVDVLRNRVFRTTGIEIQTQAKELTNQNAAKLLRGADIVVDTFDNTRSRQAVQDAVRSAKLTCLHAGLYEDYGEVIWDEQYRVPRDAGEDVCDYPLARNLVMLAVSVTCETLISFLCRDERQSWSITLRDLCIRELEGA